MKRLLIAATCMAFAGPALAQNDSNPPPRHEYHAPRDNSGGERAAPTYRPMQPHEQFGSPGGSGAYRPPANSNFYRPPANSGVYRPQAGMPGYGGEHRGWSGGPGGVQTEHNSGTNPMYEGRGREAQPPSAQPWRNEQRYGVTRTPNWNNPSEGRSPYGNRSQYGVTRQWNGNGGQYGATRQWNGNGGQYAGSHQWNGNGGDRNFDRDHRRQFTDRDWRYERHHRWGWNGQRIWIGQYYYPDGYGYERWDVGQRLPYIFLSQNYWFDDYMEYGISPPPWGYEWIRYGPDLLLVDVYSGQIVDVEYGVFY